jgi:uncharacterized membrane protein YhdT
MAHLLRPLITYVINIYIYTIIREDITLEEEEI